MEAVRVLLVSLLAVWISKGVVPDGKVCCLTYMLFNPVFLFSVVKHTLLCFALSNTIPVQ